MSVDAVLFYLRSCISPERLELTRTITVGSSLMSSSMVVDPPTPLKVKRALISSSSFSSSRNRKTMQKKKKKKKRLSGTARDVEKRKSSSFK